jgi:beta-1,4-mannosyl-glycoprotein beta-1,4-N-acetylglucosaminyltransferase
VLVEATLTHKGNPKPLYYAENKDRFQRFADKIVHVIVQDLIPNATHDYSKPQEDDVWKNENYQRNCIDCGIKTLNLSGEDLIMISDVDEIPNMCNIFYVIKSMRDTKQVAFALHQDLYYYNLMSKTDSNWGLAKIVSYKFYLTATGSSPQKCRMFSLTYIFSAGWHLSYFGSPEFIQNKIMNFSHQEYNTAEYTDLQKIEEKIRNKSDVFGRFSYTSIPIHENADLPPLHHIFFNAEGELKKNYCLSKTT